MRHFEKFAGWLVLILFALTVSGCGGGEVPDDHFYRLAPAAPTSAYQSPPIAGTLLVERLRADGVLSQRPILYVDRSQPVEVKQYSYHYWVESPPGLIQLQLVDYLRKANVANEVVERGGRVFNGCVLDGVIRSFERLTGDGDPLVSVSIDYKLTRASDGTQILFQNRNINARPNGTSMAETIMAFNFAANQIFGEIAADVAQAGAYCPVR